MERKVGRTSEENQNASEGRGSQAEPAAQSFRTAEIHTYSDQSEYEESDISDEDFLEDAKKILANAMLQENDGKEEYMVVCSEKNIVPSSLIIESLAKDELNLRHMLLMDKGCVALAAALCVNKYIKRVNLSSNGISDTGGFELAAALMENETIVCLDLSANSLSNEAGLALARALRTNRTLTELCLAKNKLGDRFVKELAGALSTTGAPGGGYSGQLKVLDLSGNKISKRGGSDLARAFEIHDARLPSHLNVGWNDLGGDGGLLFLRAALNFPRLVSLEIPFNGLTDAVAEIWEEYLKHSSLAHLDVSRNRLGIETALGIAAALKENVNLQVLKIGWNPLGTDGTKVIIQSLNENVALETLRIENTCKSGQEQEVIEEADRIMLERAVLTTVVCEYPERDRVHAAPNVPQIKDSLLAKMPSQVQSKMTPRLSKMTECSPRK